ncbi:group 1 truncated hemoglobin [Roseovarius sp. CAU 1744]|uniref:group I truncated hemoglobin n=1 Tax=Roseovarius sp. CAU 1744 TaxID=3140368 RepID=UPI00325AF23E
MEKSLFDKYGGFSTVSKIVLSLYDRLLEDDDVGPFFDDVEMPRLIDHQTKFVSSLMGGPASFSDDHIQRAHQSMVIHDHHFDRLKAILTETLNDFGVDEDDVATVVGAFEQRRPLLIGTSDVH